MSSPLTGLGAASGSGTMTVSAVTLSSRLSAATRLALDALRNPAHNPLVAVIIIGAIVVVLLIVVLMAFLIVISVRDLARRPVEKSAPPRAERKKNPRRALVVWLVLGAALLAGIIGAWNYGISDSACARCHATRSAFASRAGDQHAKVSCSRCHVAPGARGSFLAAVDGFRNARVQFAGASKDATPDTQVDRSACLSCHPDIAAGVVVANGVRMRHSDVLAVGYTCTDCHDHTGHGGGTRPAGKRQMALCIVCHDGKKTPNKCSLCHTGDVGVGSRRPGPGYVKAYIPVDSCRGCHPMQPCIECHGLELPHSKEFIAGFHARKAHLQPEICVRCHNVQEFCDSCHQFQSDPASGLPLSPHAHEGDFVTWHVKPAAETSQSCVCHAPTDRQQFCDYCHAPQPSR